MITQIHQVLLRDNNLFARIFRRFPAIISFFLVGIVLCLYSATILAVYYSIGLAIRCTARQLQQPDYFTDDHIHPECKTKLYKALWH